MGNNFSRCEILDRVKVLYKLPGKADLAKFLGISPSTLSNWYTRNSIDFDIIFTKCEDANLDWLITGRGEMLISSHEQKKTQTLSSVAPVQPDNGFVLQLLKEKDNQLREKDNEIKELSKKIGKLEAKCEFLESQNTTTAYPLAAEHELTHHYKRKK